MLERIDMLFPQRIKVVQQHEQPRCATFSKNLPTLCT